MMIFHKMRGIAGLIGLALVAACGQQVPDSGQGAGYSPSFSQFEIDRARREAQLAGTPGAFAQTATPAGGIPSSQLAAAGIGASPVTAQPLGAGTIGAGPVTGPDPLRTAGVQAAPGNAAPAVAIASTGISDEQDFDAVATRETIESDAARREQQAAAYTVIAPEALPERSDVGANIVQYALSAPNRRGQEYYSRSILSGQSRYTRNCALYRSPDDAQRDFLGRGGPERDPAGIDPDGDGFACGWDPAPFLAAVGRS